MKFDWILYGDGACSGNPGPGGWGSVFIWKPNSAEQTLVFEFGAADPQTTNNRMEIRAIQLGLEQACALLSTSGQTLSGHGAIFTDSVYVIKGITQWIFGWKKNNWMTSEGQNVQNKEFWLQLDQTIQNVRKENKLHWRYIPGHSGYIGNERCDEIAVSFSQKLNPHLYLGPVAEYFNPDILQIPAEILLPESSGGRKKVAGSFQSFYLSYVAGVLSKHNTWAECELAVKGRTGAKFKKVSSPLEETQTLEKWGINRS